MTSVLTGNAFAWMMPCCFVLFVLCSDRVLLVRPGDHSLVDDALLVRFLSSSRHRDVSMGLLVENLRGRRAGTDWVFPPMVVEHLQLGGSRGLSRPSCSAGDAQPVDSRRHFGGVFRLGFGGGDTHDMNHRWFYSNFSDGNRVF